MESITAYCGNCLRNCDRLQRYIAFKQVFFKSCHIDTVNIIRNFNIFPIAAICSNGQTGLIRDIIPITKFMRFPHHTLPTNREGN